MQLPAIQKLPLHLFTRFQPDGRRQGQGKTHVEPRLLRCTILRPLLQEGYRGFSRQLAGNPLYQWFCQVDALDIVRVPSKSELQRFAHWLPAGQMHQVIDGRQWEQTEWTRPQAEQILRRLDGVLAWLPQAQKQAHERIIGNRPVANADKILSLYEPQVRVIVRGKAGAEVEFGNTVLMGEN